MKEIKACIFAKNDTIYYSGINRSKSKLYQYTEKASKKYTATILISGASPDGTKLVFFVDRRERDSEQREDDAPNMLYPHDKISGFYFLDIKTKAYKKIPTKGEFKGWVSNSKVIFTTNRLSAGTPNYEMLDLASNQSVHNLRFPKGFSMHERFNSGEILVEFEHQGKFEVCYAKMDQNLNMKPITSWISASDGNSPRLSPFNQDLATIRSVASRSAKMEWTNTILINGKPRFNFKSKNALHRYDWLEKDKMVFLTFDSTVIIFNTSQNRIVFVENLKLFEIPKN